MTRYDWPVILTWSVLGLFTGAFWAAVIAFALMPFASGALETIGTLNGCERLNLMPGECAAYAEGR